MTGALAAAVLLATLLPLAALAQETLAPSPGVEVHGVPPIASALAARLEPYAEFIPHRLVAWHPTRREMLVQRGGHAARQLHLVTEPGVRPVPLAELPPATVAEWNRAGEPAPGVARAIARLERLGHVEISVSPDARRLASVQVVDPLESHLWVTEVASGKRRRLTRGTGGEKVSYRLPRFAPDGKAIFATSDRGSEWRRLVRIPLAGGAERVLTAHLAHDIDEHELSADARRIAFTANEGGSHSLRFIDLASLEEQPRPPLLNGVISGIAWRAGSAEIAFRLAGARSAGDVFSYDVEAHKLARWTNGNGTRVNVSRFAEPRTVKWAVGGGITVAGFHYHPPERFTGRRPVLVDFRAGAAQQARAGFLGERNYLVNELGIAVLHPNVRGASGFGKSFRRLGLGPRRDASMNDVAAMLDWIRAQPDLDPDRVLLAGLGSGADLALAAAAEHHARVAGVIAVLPSGDRASMAGLRVPSLIVVARDERAGAPSGAAAAAAANAWRIEVAADGTSIRRPEDAKFVAAAVVELAQKVLQ